MNDARIAPVAARLNHIIGRLTGSMVRGLLFNEAKELLAIADDIQGLMNKSSITMEQALKPLAAIADAYDANSLDDEARRYWGPNLEKENTDPPCRIELYHGRGGNTLLTLQDCFNARDALNAKGVKLEEAA